MNPPTHEDQPRPPWPQVILLNLGLMSVLIGSTLPLFRRGWQEPSRSLLSQFVTGLLPEVILLFLLGLSLQIWRRWRQGESLQPAAAASDGVGLWQGYALVVALSATAYHGFLTAFYLERLGSYPRWLDGLPYQGIGPPLRQALTGPHMVAFGLMALGVLLGLGLNRRPRLRSGLVWGSLGLMLASGVYPAQRQAVTRQVVASGDQVGARLQPIRRLGGGALSPDELANHLTLVEFFTTWCGSCKRLLPRLRALDKDITDPRFRVFLISRDASDGGGSVVPKLKRYEARYRPGLEILVDGRSASSWGGQVGITVYPTLALIDPEGRVRRLWSGTPGPGELEAEVRQALIDHSRF